MIREVKKLKKMLGFVLMELIWLVPMKMRVLLTQLSHLPLVILVYEIFLLSKVFVNPCV
uniref:Uncharacterized protein n=1 Tax=Rhizophora mucronata TaxID=61149 RepID=A0A2P2JE53_RHIMU